MNTVVKANLFPALSAGNGFPLRVARADNADTWKRRRRLRSCYTTVSPYRSFLQGRDGRIANPSEWFHHSACCRRRKNGEREMRILSVSYDELLLQTRHEMLQNEGYEVVSALGFQASLEHCKGGRL